METDRKHWDFIFEPWYRRVSLMIAITLQVFVIAEPCNLVFW